jgi:hypothetical protein
LRSHIADRAQPGDGILIPPPYERTPVEWYMAERAAVARDVHPAYLATAMNGAPGRAGCTSAGTAPFPEGQVTEEVRQ